MTEVLVGIDTSNAACSCGLSVEGELRERYHEAPRGHGELLLPMVDELLAEAGIGVGQIDALVVGRGPGSFTGLRIAIGVIQGLAFALDRPVVMVSSLAAMAQGAAADPRAQAGHTIVASFDARMGEVYWGAYQCAADGLVQPLCDDALSSPDELALPAGAGSKGWLGIGPGWAAYEERLRAVVAAAPGEAALSDLTVLGLPRFVHGSDLLALGARDWRAGNAVSADRAQPVYLRNKVVD